MNIEHESVEVWPQLHEEELYNIAESWTNNKVPDKLKERCAQEFPITTVSLSNNLNILRAENFGMAIPYLEETLVVLNNNLPPAYPRFQLGDLVEKYHTIPDGRTFDFKETWKGNTFLIQDNKNLVGVALGRKEVVVKNGVSTFTGAGFMPVIAAVESIRQTPKTMLLFLPMKSLVECGATIIRASCAPSNALAEKLFSSLASERRQEGDWIRYSTDVATANRLFNIITKKFHIGETESQRLIAPVLS